MKPATTFMIAFGIIALFVYFIFRGKPVGSSLATNYEPTNDNTGSSTNPTTPLE